MLLLLLREILVELHVLSLSLSQSIGGIISELLDELESLNCFSFNFTVVGLHEFQISLQGLKLAIQQRFKKNYILPLSGVLVKNRGNILDWGVSLATTG